MGTFDHYGCDGRYKRSLRTTIAYTTTASCTRLTLNNAIVPGTRLRDPRTIRHHQILLRSHIDLSPHCHSVPCRDSWATADILCLPTFSNQDTESGWFERRVVGAEPDRNAAHKRVFLTHPRSPFFQLVYLRHLITGPINPESLPPLRLC